MKQNKEMVTISKREYDSLIEDSAFLSFLEALGVDNWQGYRRPPDREDYETDEEYEKAYDSALYDY